MLSVVACRLVKGAWDDALVRLAGFQKSATRLPRQRYTIFNFFILPIVDDSDLIRRGRRRRRLSEDESSYLGTKLDIGMVQGPALRDPGATGAVGCGEKTISTLRSPLSCKSLA